MKIEPIYLQLWEVSYSISQINDDSLFNSNIRKIACIIGQKTSIKDLLWGPVTTHAGSNKVSLVLNIAVVLDSLNHYPKLPHKIRGCIGTCPCAMLNRNMLSVEAQSHVLVQHDLQPHTDQVRCQPGGQEDFAQESALQTLQFLAADWSYR